MPNVKKPKIILSTQEAVRAAFDCVDGVLINRETGNAVGYPVRWGYLKVDFRYRSYFAHRLVFLWHHGWLPEQIDHIDRNPVNNRIENLRPTTPYENRMNQGVRKTNKVGVTGVCWHKSAKKWQARAHVNGKRVDLGRFDALDDAIKAVQNAV